MLAIGTQRTSYAPGARTRALSDIRGDHPAAGELLGRRLFVKCQ